jgi:ribonuclease P protein component
VSRVFTRPDARAFGFGPERRIRRRADFLRVQSIGQRATTPHFVLLVAAREEPRAHGDSVAAAGKAVLDTNAPSVALDPQRDAQSAPKPRDASGCARLGIVVTKKVGNAVQRNRIKRVCRECFRLWPDLVPDGIDLVVIARSRADELGLAAVQSEWERARPALLKRCAAVLGQK